MEVLRRYGHRSAWVWLCSILYGIPLWPGIVLGDLAVADFSQPAGTMLGQTVGNTLEVVIAAVLFYRLSEGRTQFGRVRDVARAGRSSRRGNGRKRGVRSSLTAPRRCDPERTAGDGLADLVPRRSLRCAGVRPVAAVLGGCPDRCVRPAAGFRGRCNRDADRRARASSVPARRAVYRVSGPDLGGASRGAAWRSRCCRAGHHAHRLQHRTPRRPVYTGNDHPKPARYAVVRGRGSHNVAGARCGH